MSDPGRLALVFVVGLACGVHLMGWLYERRELKRQERYWRRLLGEDVNAPPFRNPTQLPAEYRRGSNPPPNAVKPPPPPSPPPMRIIREGGRPPRAPEDVR